MEGMQRDVLKGSDDVPVSVVCRASDRRALGLAVWYVVWFL